MVLEQIDPSEADAQGNTADLADERVSRFFETGTCPHYTDNNLVYKGQAFDPFQILGPWVEIYGEKGLNDEIKCKGIRLDMIDHSLVSVSNTALLTEQGKKQSLEAGGNPDELDRY